MAVSLPSEKTEYRDSRTGARMVRWTVSPDKDRHLYFTSPSVTADDRWLVFISERSGDPNLFVIDRASGELQQISDNNAGLLHAYVYPYGGDTGLSKASPALDAHSGTLVWVQDHAVWTAQVGVDGQPARRVCELPKGRVIDGRDIRDLLTGKPGAKSPYDAFIYHARFAKRAGIRVGDWKLLVDCDAKTWRQKGDALYNLKRDPGDSVAEENPDKVKQLKARLRAFEQELSQNTRPTDRLETRIANRLEERKT